jgi:hypothetical protein
VNAEIVIESDVEAMSSRKNVSEMKENKKLVKISTLKVSIIQKENISTFLS